MKGPENILPFWLSGSSMIRCSILFPLLHLPYAVWMRSYIEPVRVDFPSVCNSSLFLSMLLFVVRRGMSEKIVESDLSPLEYFQLCKSRNQCGVEGTKKER